MVNKGSPLAMLDVINAVEHISTIGEGQIRTFVKDPTTGAWVAQSSIPAMSSPATSFNVVVKSLSNAAAIQMPDQPCHRCLLIAHPDNTTRVWIGGSSVSNQVGIPLEPGQSQELAVANVNLVYSVSETNGDKIIVAHLG